MHLMTHEFASTTRRVDRPMSWMKVDDGCYSHPTTFDASDGAVAFWTRSGSWAGAA